MFSYTWYFDRELHLCKQDLIHNTLFALHLIVHTFSTTDIAGSTQPRPELTSLPSDPEGIIGSAKPPEVLACSEDATSTSASEAILNAGNSDDANRDFQGAGEQQVEPGPLLGDKDGSSATTLQEVIADEVKSQVVNALAPILDIVEEAV